MPHLAINGGEKACDIEWPQWPYWDDEERQALSDVLESGKWWYGEKVAEFEAAFAAFQGARFGVACSSGTTALETALIGLGVGAGDEVIVPSYTFMATASSVLRVNAVPVFADIQPRTLCIDPDDVRGKLTDKTKAIIPVHFAGHVADMDRLAEIAADHHLYIIEDACHAWGSQWKGKGAGAIGHCGAFSFQASKNITSGEGGIILTDNEELADICRSYTNCGRAKGGVWYEHHVMGGNVRLTEFQAAILLAQLNRLEQQTLTRQARAEILTEGLNKIPCITTIENDPRMTRRAYHLFPFRLDMEALGVTRDRFVEVLREEGVAVNPGYHHLLHRNPVFEREAVGPRGCPLSCPYYGSKIDYAATVCPECERACDDTCWIWHTVLLADEPAIYSVIEAVRKVVGHIDEARE